MSRSSMGQAFELTGKLRDVSDTKVQRLIDNWDLATMLIERDPSGVDRYTFARLLEGKLALADPFAQYADMLVSPFDWLDVLRRYNQQYWANHFTDADFALAEATLVAVPEDHVQAVTKCYGFHVQFSSTAETIEMWRRVFQGELAKFFEDTEVHTWVWDQISFDDEHFGFHELARTYEPGIHLFCMNVVAHWEPEEGRTLIQVREQAGSSGEILAQLEVVSLWGVLIKLFMQQDGTNFPWSDMPGTDLKVPGGSEPYAFYMYWYRDGRQAGFYASWVARVLQNWAAPVLREL